MNISHYIHTTSEIDCASDLLMPSESLLSEPCINLLFFFILDLPLNLKLINNNNNRIEWSPVTLFWCAIIHLSDIIGCKPESDLFNHQMLTINYSNQDFK